MPIRLEDTFVTEGIPEFTFVEPPNYNEILLDIRRAWKPVIIEGQSGTWKTTTAKKILNQLSSDIVINYYTARQPDDLEKIIEVMKNRPAWYFIIDDFHRLPQEVQEGFAHLAKLAAETQDTTLPKLILIWINQVWSSLINLVHDIAKRCWIHRILPGSKDAIIELINVWSRKLNIQIANAETIFDESKWDYWLTQSLCQTICAHNNITEEQQDLKGISFSLDGIRRAMTLKLSHSYKDPLKEFSRWRRFRPSNDPYFKLLKLISEQDSSIVDLNELANASDEMRASINWIKEKRLSILLESKPICNRFFFYNPESKSFAIEDPALFYYIKCVDWDEIRKECGFREIESSKEFDVAISFAGENRELAKYIADQLEQVDVRVFYDEYYETNYLWKAWGKEFERIFMSDSRLVVCLLDDNHKNKIWPTFERSFFEKRVPDAEVIPIYLDKTIFVSIPSDTVGIKFNWDPSDLKWKEKADNDIVYKIWERLE